METSPQPSYDERLIDSGIQYAREHDVPISDKVAARIASQLHGGQASALYSFASSGAIDMEKLWFECYQAQTDPHLLDHEREWIDFFINHVGAAPDLVDGRRPPVEGWFEKAVKDSAPDYRD